MKFIKHVPLNEDASEGTDEDKIAEIFAGFDSRLFVASYLVVGSHGTDSNPYICFRSHFHLISALKKWNDGLTDGQTLI